MFSVKFPKKAHISLVLLLLFSSPLTFKALAREHTGDGRSQIVVPRDFPTIQEAVESVADGGRIVVQSGSYEEVITIEGKSIDLVGEGRPQILGAIPERVTDVDLATGLVNYLEGGGGSISGFVFTGGDAAIYGFGDREFPAPLVVQDVVIQASGRGIVWSGESLQVQSTGFVQTLYNALVAKNIADLGVIESHFLGGKHPLLNNPSRGTGLVLVNCGIPHTAQVIDNVFTYWPSGGIYAKDSVVSVTGCLFSENTIADIRSLGSDMFVTDSWFLLTHDDPQTGVYGDGIIASVSHPSNSSNATIENCHFLYQSRSGIANFGSHVDLKDNSIHCAAFSINGENIAAYYFGDWPLTTITWTFDDSGGNGCGCPAATNKCLAASSSLGPPEAISDPL